MKDNELFGQLKVDFASAHMSYLRLLISVFYVKSYELKDLRIRELVLDLLRIHAIDELKNDVGHLYDTGFFGKGVRSFLDKALD